MHTRTHTHTDCMGIGWYMRVQQESKFLGRKRTNENGKQACVTPPQKKKEKISHTKKILPFIREFPSETRLRVYVCVCDKYIHASPTHTPSSHPYKGGEYTCKK